MWLFFKERICSQNAAGRAKRFSARAGTLRPFSRSIFRIVSFCLITAILLQFMAPGLGYISLMAYGKSPVLHAQQGIPATGLDIALTTTPVVAPTTTNAPAWPTFQQNPQRTGYTPYSGPGYSEPAVRPLIGEAGKENYFYPVVLDAEGNLYFRARLDREFGLYSFDPEGKERWRYNTPDYHISSDPLIGNDGTIFAQTLQQLMAFNPDGSIRWTRDLAGKGWVVEPGPPGIILVWNMVKLPGKTEYSYCLLAFTYSGEVAWIYDMETEATYSNPTFPLVQEGPMEISPTPSPDPTRTAVNLDGTIYFGRGDTLYAINADGTKKWEKSFIAIDYDGNTIGEGTAATPSIGPGGTIYLAGGSKYSSWSGWSVAFHALHPENPSIELWEAKYLNSGIIGLATITPFGDVFVRTGYYTPYGWGNSLYGFNPQGDYLPHWPVSPDMGGRWGPLVIDGSGIIYGLFGLFASSLKAFNQQGEDLWSVYIEAYPNQQNLIALGPNGTIYINGRDHIYAVGGTPDSPSPPPPPIWTPSMNFTISPTRPVVGQEVTFNASSLQLQQGNITSYKWNFGDGKTAEGPVVAHTYTRGNLTYTVKLTVTDDTGANFNTFANLRIFQHPLKNEINNAYNKAGLVFSQIKFDTLQISKNGDFFAEKLAEQEARVAINFILGCLNTVVSVAQIDIIDKAAFSGKIDASVNHMVKLMPPAVQNSFARDSSQLMYTSLKYLGYEAANDAIKEAAKYGISELHVNRALKNRLNDNLFEGHLAPATERLINIYQEDLQKTANLLISSPRPQNLEMSQEEIELYREDLSKRATANQMMSMDLNRESNLLTYARANREAKGVNAIKKFALKLGIRIIFKTILDGPGVLLYSLGNLAWETHQNTARLREDGRILGIASAATFKANDISRRIYLNNYRGLANLMAGETPLVARGEKINNFHIVKLEEKHGGYGNAVTEAYTDIVIENTGSADTLYEVTARWDKWGALGTSYTEMTDYGSVVIPAGERKNLRVYYLKDGQGEFPARHTPITLTILGTTDTGTYFISQFDSSFWVPGVPFGEFGLQEESPEEPIYLYPVSSWLESFPEEPLNSLLISAENPFAAPMNIALFQQISEGFSVIDPAGGALEDGILSWEKTLEAGEMALFEVTLACFLEPGTEIEFPGVIMEMREAGDEEGVSFQGNSLLFEHRIPLLAFGEPPLMASPGDSLIIPVTLTNLLEDASLEGALAINLLDKNGENLLQHTQVITLAPGETREKNISLTLDVEAGVYPLTGIWQAYAAEISIFNEILSVDVGHLYGRVLLTGVQKHAGTEVKLGEYSTLTDTDGSFSFLAVPIGTYNLKIIRPGYLPYTEEVIIAPEAPVLSEIELSLKKQPPTALFNYASASPYSPKERSFSALASFSPDDEIVSYQWDFGDGNSKVGEAVNHTYSEEGAYEVTLTVADSRGLKDAMTQEVTVGEGWRLTGLGTLQAVLFEDETVDLTVNPQSAPRQVLLKDSSGEPIGRFTVLFDQAAGDIDLSGIAAATHLEKNKSLLHLAFWPEEVEEEKTLYIPSSNTGTVYLCPDADNLEEVDFSNPDRIIINVGQSLGNLTVETAVYREKEYYVVIGIQGGGGGELPAFGDVNGDGKVDIEDAILVLKHIVGLVDLAHAYGPAALSRGRVSGRAGSPDIGDAILLLRRIVGLNTEFPAER